MASASRSMPSGLAVITVRACRHHPADDRADPTRGDPVADAELIEHAQSLLAQNAYLTLGTVDADGRPWTSPVYFAADDLIDFYWVSSPEARHSLNLAVRPAVSLVVFDSTVRPYHG